MSRSAGADFAVEVHPPDWRFPAGQSWIAGWIRPEAGRRVTDVRARIHHRVILGLAGLPHAAFPERAGFSFFLAPQRGATLLQLEARGPSGEWTEFFRTTVSPAADAPIPPAAASLSQAFDRLVVDLIKTHRLGPARTWADLAEELVVAWVAEPLNAHPNVPLVGALEEPGETGRFRYGVIPVTGWLAHGQSGIRQLTAVIDPLPPADLAHGLVRRDIVGAFPQLGDQAKSAFAAEIALPADFASPVLLKIFAELDNGDSHLAFAQRFTPRFHRSPGELPPQVSWVAFCCAVWALHRAAGRYAMSRRGLIRTAQSFWSRHQARPAYRPARTHREKSGRSFRAGARRSPDDGLTAAPVTLPARSDIAPADDMFGRDSAQYFQIGREALALIQSACALAGCERIESILDLPCGHGRVARWLRAAYPAADLAVSDTQGPGVKFCIEQLGATGVTATRSGIHWEALPGPFDIIWCGSLLTHLDRDQWLLHLRRFAERLSPHGVLVFTTHGLVALDKLQTGEKDYGLPPVEVTRLCTDAVVRGFGYVDYPDTPAYGISVSQPDWIRELVDRETDLHVRAIHESAWDQHQDVVVCTRRPAGERPSPAAASDGQA
jgi:SAM-dependent methyltransferase